MCISIGHLLALVTSALCVRKLFLLSQTERVTHWGTLKSGGLSESERHLVGPIVHIEVTNATTYTCTLEVPSPSVKN